MTKRALIAIGFLFCAHPLHAAPRSALFALIIGTNQSVDKNQSQLRYADDDAARYLELFRSIGAKTYLLSRFDENTRKLHPQAAAESTLPTHEDLDQVIMQISRDVERAKGQGIETVFYFAYAGHGNVRDGKGYLSLENGKIDRRRLSTALAQIDAQQNHLIIDACYSYYLALERGPGGARRPVQGFSQDFAKRDNIGFLLSTSSAQESHEWEGFEAGVFSYEVRAGLYGAADANNDGQISYQEIAAFIKKANRAISSERFRPDVFAKAPAHQNTLVDLKNINSRAILIDGEHHAHFLLEDARGVRLTEFHNNDNQPVSLLRPAMSNILYLRNLDDESEYKLDGGSDEVLIASLTPTPVRMLSRGAAHEAFSSIFSLPFGQEDVDSYVFHSPPPLPRDRARDRRIAGWSMVGLSGVTMILGSTFAILGRNLHDSVTSSTSQADVIDINRQIDRYNITSGVLLGAAAASAVTGAVLLLLPQKPVPWITPQITRDQVTLSFGGVF